MKSKRLKIEDTAQRKYRLMEESTPWLIIISAIIGFGISIFWGVHQSRTNQRFNLDQNMVAIATVVSAQPTETISGVVTFYAGCPECQKQKPLVSLEYENVNPDGTPTWIPIQTPTLAEMEKTPVVSPITGVTQIFDVTADKENDLKVYMDLVREAKATIRRQRSELRTSWKIIAEQQLTILDLEMKAPKCPTLCPSPVKK